MPLESSTYLDWNNLIAQRFFRPEQAGRQVYIFASEQFIQAVGDEIGGGAGLEEFVAAVKQGPPWVTRPGLCQRARQAFEGWRDRELDYPPYIGYLALFSLAAGLEGRSAPQEYYGRLWKLLDEPGHGAVPSFDRMLDLWDDLERWSAHDRSGALGVFEVRWAGERIHVDIPRAQAILSEHERVVLPSIFADSGM